MDPLQKQNLRINQVELVKNLEANDILDYLLEDGILTENDCELISNTKTRKERAQLLLALLPTRGPNAYGSFRRALNLGKYEFLQEKLASANTNREHEENIRTGRTSDDLQRCLRIISSCKNDKFRHILSSHGFLLIDNVEPVDVVDHFVQDLLITDDGVELIKVGQTRKERCFALLHELSKVRSNNVVHVLIKSLEKKYKYISEVIRTSFDAIHHDPVAVDENRNLSCVKTNIIANNTCPKDLHGTTENRELYTRDPHRPTENSEPQTQTSPKSLSQTRLSITTLKQTNDVQRPTRTCNVTSSEFTTLPYINGVENTDYDLKRTQVNSKEPCENETFSHERVTYVRPTAESNSRTSILDATLSSVSEDASSEEMSRDTNPKNIEKLVTSTESNCEQPPKLFNTDESSLLNNVTDGSIIIPRERFQSNRPVLMTLNSTDSETDDTMTEKPRRKYKNVKRQMDNVNKGISVTTEQVATPKTSFPKNCCTVVTTINDDNCPTVNNEIKEYSVLNYQPGGTTESLSGKHLVMTFNYLSTLINQGSYDKFEYFSSNLKHKYSQDPDMKCLLGYLHASRDLFKTDFTSAKKHIDAAFEIVPQTSNPKYFTLELFTTKTRMYISQKKLEKLQNALDDAKMIIETDPLGCTGRASGWLYMNDARNCTAQIGLLSFRNPKAIVSYTSLHNRAKTSFQKALTNFDRDGGKDGPFGFGYALCRLAILLLRCGDNGRTMDILLPPEDDVKLAGGYLQKLEDSEIAIPKILEMHFSLAKADYQFRRRNITRGLEYAELAYTIASDLNLLEFTEHAHNRCVFLRTKRPMIIEDISEDEFKTALFGEQACETSDKDIC